MEIKDSYKAQYKMRTTGKNGMTTIITLPPMVVEREASKRGLTVAEFIEQFRVVAHFNNFEGVFYTFEEPKQKVEAPSRREATKPVLDELFELRRKLKEGGT